MGKISDIVKDLPEELQPVASDYLNLLIYQGEENTKEFIELLVNGFSAEAYEILCSNMTTEKLLEEMQRNVDRLKELNDKQADLAVVHRNVIRDVLFIGLSAMKKELI